MSGKTFYNSQISIEIRRLVTIGNGTGMQLYFKGIRFHACQPRRQIFRNAA